MLLILIVGLLGSMVIWVASRWGIGASPDSVVYIIGARSIANGHGFSLPDSVLGYVPVTHHAPLYSALLALVDLLGLDVVQGARWMNALLLMGSVFVFGWAVQSFIQRNSMNKIVLPVSGAAILLTSVSMLQIHLMAWTEPLFIFTLLLGFSFLTKWLDGAPGQYLFAAGICVAAACLTRYAGIALAATGAIAILLFHPQNQLSAVENNGKTIGHPVKLSRRVASAALFSGVVLAPLLVWMGRNAILAGSATSREFEYHLITWQQLGQGLTTMGGWWFIPAGMSSLVKLTPYVVLGTAYLILVIGQKSEHSYEQRSFGQKLNQLPAMIKIGLIFMPLYIAFLFFSISFLDANTPLDDRILSPIYGILALLVFYLVQEYVKWFHLSIGATTALVSIGVLFLFANGYRTSALLRQSYLEGLGFMSREWRESIVLQQARRLPETTSVFSNAPEAVLLHTSLTANRLPRKYEPANRQANVNYPTEMNELRRQMGKSSAAIIFFTRLNINTLPSLQELETDYGLTILYQAEDGVILGAAGQ
jgi:hypothetical protein